MAVRIYDPTSPWAPSVPARPAQIAKPLAPGASPYAARARMPSDGPTVRLRQSGDDDKGLGDRFAGTTLGKGLGVVLNNPIVKNAMVPLGLLSIPQRAITSTIREGVDVFGGGDASFSDWWQQALKPSRAVGMGDLYEELLQETGMGDTFLGNDWVKAGVGFAGDTLTDPLTYLGGLGVVTKGLGPTRAGSRLGAAVRAADEAQALRAAGDLAGAAKVVPVIDAAAAAENAANRVSRAALSGRMPRMERVSEATRLIERAEAGMPGALDTLYERANVAEEALREIQWRASRGLGARSKSLSDEAANLVETALNIKPPASYIRGTKFRTKGGLIAQPFSNLVGEGRQRFAASRTGQALIDADSPIDYERAVRLLAQGERTDATNFRRAAEVVTEVTGRRPIAGEVLVLGQNAGRGQRANVTQQIRQAGGKENYLLQAETQGGTVLNDLFRFAGETLPQRFGVTIPKLGSGNLHYVPHQWAPEFRRLLATQTESGAPAIWAEDLIKRLGGNRVQDLLGESGHLQSRQILPNVDLPLPNGATFNTGDGTIATINRNARAAGFKGRLLEDDPIKLYDDYVQVLADDIARRASRAEQIAIGSQNMRYADDLDPQLQDEAYLENVAARERLDLPELERGAFGDQFFLQQVTVPQLDNVAQAASQPGAVSQLVQSAFEDWTRVGANKAVMLDPAVDAMYKNVLREIRDAGPLVNMYRALNRYFKNFAVLTPGFHSRNFLSAVFMNIADGVPLRTTRRGFNLWGDFAKASKNGADIEGGIAFLDKISRRERDAFDAVFASGAGGRFAEAGIGDTWGSKASKALLDNRVSRWSQDVGASVEGRVRLGMALDTLESGGSVAEAASRITRVHFDYSQTSRADDKIKSIMPFWSFLSRNVPLQMMQMWARPTAYLGYERFRENFANTGNPDVTYGEAPDYIRNARGIPLGMGPLGNWFEPDLPHTRVAEDVERYANILNDPLGATSGLSPVLTAPVEYAFGQDAFTGQRFEGDDVSQVSPTPWGLLQAIAGSAAGATHWDVNDPLRPYVEDRFTNAFQAIDPVTSRASRMSGGEGRERERIIETWLRFLGMPVRNITDEQIRNARRSERFDELDARALERALGR